MIAVDDATELAVWGFLFDTDLVGTWKCDERPVDDIVREAVHDRRACAVSEVDDEQWIRLVDVDRALRARTYNAASDAVTIGVTDPRIPTNDGTWCVDARGAARTDDAAQLRVGIAALSAAYLGGTSWHALAATGRVHSSEPAAVALADTLFASRPLPFCGSFF